MLSRY
jgi:hypothetical protein